MDFAALSCFWSKKRSQPQQKNPLLHGDQMKLKVGTLYLVKCSTDAKYRRGPVIQSGRCWYMRLRTLRIAKDGPE